MADVVNLEPWHGPWPEDDPDANFKIDVALYNKADDPLAAIRMLSSNLDIPEGALVRYVLAKWASGGADGLLELGPSTVARMTRACEEAEAAGTDEARLTAYRQLRAMLSWLNEGL